MGYMNPYILAFNSQPSSFQHVDNYRPYRQNNSPESLPQDVKANLPSTVSATFSPRNSYETIVFEGPPTPFVVTTFSISYPISPAIVEREFKFPRSPLPVYLAVNITEQLYRSKFILGLSLRLVLLDTNPEEQVVVPWESIIAFLEQSALELDRAARKRNGAGLGSISVLEAQIVGVGVLAEWRFWSVVDGITTTCEG